jgi:hypothetical protein
MKIVVDMQLTKSDLDIIENKAMGSDITDFKNQKVYAIYFGRYKSRIYSVKLSGSVIDIAQNMVKFNNEKLYMPYFKFRIMDKNQKAFCSDVKFFKNEETADKFLNYLQNGKAYTYDVIVLDNKNMSGTIFPDIHEISMIDFELYASNYNSIPMNKWFCNTFYFKTKEELFNHRAILINRYGFVLNPNLK